MDDILAGAPFLHILYYPSNTLAQEKYGKSISKDTWSLFLDFIDSCDDEFKEYDEDGAWPVVIDSFVEYARAHLNV